MRKIDGKKAIRIVLSVLMAIGIWLYIDYTDPVDVKMRAKAVPIEFLGADTTLADRGLVVVESSAETVDLTLRAPRKYFLGLSPSDIRAVVDLRDVEDVGNYTLSYTLMYPDDVQKSRISVETASVYTVRVQIGELYKKTVDVQYEVTGEVPDGYIAYPEETEVGSLVIHGQQSDVMRVSYAKVSLDITGRTSSASEMLTPLYYDSGNQLIEDAVIYANKKELPITVPIYQKKTVPLAADILPSTGVAAEDVTLTFHPQTVSLAGEYYLMNTLEELSVGTVDLAKVADGETLHFPISLPNGMVSTDGVTDVTAEVSLKSVTMKEYIATRFAAENVPQGLSASVMTEVLAVTLRGRAAAFADLPETALLVTADLSQITEAGTYSVPASVRCEGAAVDVLGSYTVTVSVGEASPAVEAE